MSLESQEARRMAAPLGHRVGVYSDAKQIAEAVFTICQEIDAALVPIVGLRGAAALYSRSLHLTVAAYPWMAGLLENTVPDLSLAALTTVLNAQGSANAAAGSNAFLQAFHELLASLVGSALSERLLRSVWADPAYGPQVRENSNK